MTIKKDFENQYSPLILETIYWEYIYHSGSRGVDYVNAKNYADKISENIQLISKKVLEGSYVFTKYKLRLVSKGRGKVPREISIPTIRDRITLKALSLYLNAIYKSETDPKLPQYIISEIKSYLSTTKYDTCIKLDVENFYPSIKHSELLKRLRRKIRHKICIDLILHAVTTPTVIKPSNTDQRQGRGVPQGLSISNILSAVYLINIDSKLKHDARIQYYRYVDDILIFANRSDVECLVKDISSLFKRIGLVVHDPHGDSEKSTIIEISKGFSYLGYTFNGDMTSVRGASIDKLKSSLISIFTSYKYARNKRPEFLEWRLNLRLTGCVFEGKSKGWLFYFSEIDDMELLHKLDHFVDILKKRFSVHIKTKKLVKAYYEIKCNRHVTKYIPNFDAYNIDQKRELLESNFNLKLGKASPEDIENLFFNKISGQVKDLLEDIRNNDSSGP